MPSPNFSLPSILFITNEVPSYTGGGTVIRDFNLLKNLSANYRFTLLCFTDNHDEDSLKLTALADLCERIITIPRQPAIANRWLIRASLFAQVFHPVPRWVQSLTPKAMKVQAQALYRDISFDAVYINHVEMAPLFIGSGSAARVIGQEVVAPKVLRLLATTSGPLGRLSTYAEWRKMQCYERKLYRSVDLCIMTSEIEKQNVLDQAPCANVVVVPNGVDTTLLQPPTTVSIRDTNDPALLFLGSLAYPPNHDAILYFRNEIWPLIESRFPGVRWLIAGRNPAQEILRLASPNVEVLGWVTDVCDLMHGSSAMIVPLRSGSGTRLKILDAWAAGLPIVSTFIGAEGLEAHDGENILLADNPVQFAEAVLRLLRDPNLRQQLAANGRNLVETQYDWRTITPRLDQAFQDVIARRR